MRRGGVYGERSDPALQSESPSDGGELLDWRRLAWVPQNKITVLIRSDYTLSSWHKLPCVDGGVMTRKDVLPAETD